MLRQDEDVAVAGEVRVCAGQRAGVVEIAGPLSPADEPRSGDVRAIMGYAAGQEFGARCPPRRSSWCGWSYFPSEAVGTARGVGAGDGGVGPAGRRQDGAAADLD